MTTKDAQIIIAEIEKLNYKPNDFEKGFMASIRNSPWITQKQSGCLMAIYGKATGGGIYEKKQYFKR